MKWKSRYQSPDPSLWQGRNDTPPESCLFQIIRFIDLKQDQITTCKNHNFALVGFCCDEGIKRNQGRIGAADGPQAIRSFLAKLPLLKPTLTCFDVGNIICTDGDLEASQQALSEVVAMLLSKNITPIVLGGGHELAWGNYQGIAKIYSQEKLGIVNFDAHFDMRPLMLNDKGNSGTPFLQIAKDHAAANRPFDYNCMGIQRGGNIKLLFDTAMDYHVHTILADDLHQKMRDKCTHFIERIIMQNQILYLTLCLDVFAAPFAPGVSAPQVFGVTPWDILPYFRLLAASGKVVSYDIAELSPPYDPDQRTAKLAANFVFEILHHHKKYRLGADHDNHATS